MKQLLQGLFGGERGDEVSQKQLIPTVNNVVPFEKVAVKSIKKIMHHEFKFKV